jgi:hypothetical protein
LKNWWKLLRKEWLDQTLRRKKLLLSKTSQPKNVVAKSTEKWRRDWLWLKPESTWIECGCLAKMLKWKIWVLAKDLVNLLSPI